MAVKRKQFRKDWERYMKDRLYKLYKVSFNPQVQSLRDSGDIVDKRTNPYRVFEGVGVDYRTYVLKVRTSGAVPLPTRLEDLEDLNI